MLCCWGWDVMLCIGEACLQKDIERDNGMYEASHFRMGSGRCNDLGYTTSENLNCPASVLPVVSAQDIDAFFLQAQLLVKRMDSSL